MIIREYTSAHCNSLAELFYNTVHSINEKDYSEEQLNVWATGRVNFEAWNRSFLEHFTVVAVDDDVIVGFGDIDKTGYLDRLFVHKNYQKRGIAKAICDELEKKVNTERFITHTSITARSFFEKRGYRVLKEQQVEREGVILLNYVMEK
ncbi:GNAT family N-acetyltransferase [Clostridium botulinum]|uniref:GNAT family N-acetyltransferase n=1 Tax=Clostridium sp. ZBS20 TaxID=2949966 RepID=UPI0020798A80|nr:GNAT family N-acetyltransferase [Clostridium sp. ZBS20]MBN1052467.1 GNAT family N-acetyltransferase [Clostridium botulinum]